MNSGCPANRLSRPPRRSTCSTTAASKPMPAWNRKYRSLMAPRPIRRMEAASMASSRAPVASTASSGRPMVRAKTLVDPPGSAARAVSVPARPLAASFSVPSPPRTTTTSMPSLAALWASRVAWPRRVVAATSRRWSAERAFWMTMRVRAVTDEADGFTIRSSFTGDSSYDLVWLGHRRTIGRVGRRSVRVTEYCFQNPVYGWSD